jgi:acetolactate synthase-1/2/3 large subunit
MDLPKDVTAGQVDGEDIYCPEDVSMRSYNPTYEGSKKMIREAVNELVKAKRPVFMGGGGIILSGAHEQIRELAELTQVPVTLTLMGLGAFPGTNPLFLGMLGMHGTYAANMAVQNADLLIGIGVRFDDRVTGKLETFASKAKIIHIDIDPTSIRKNVRVDIPIVGDVTYVLNDMLDIIRKEEKTQWIEIRKAWLKQVNAWKEERPLTYEYDEQEIKPQYVVEKLYEITKGDAIITTEVGQNQMWAAQFYKYDKPRTWLSSGGLGTMGYGFPAAIGAQVACPDRVVIDIAGDGSIQMNIQELATAVIEKLPVKVAILNNQYLGMVRQWQEMFFGERYSHSHLNVVPDFVKVAEAYGAVGLRANRPDEVEEVIHKAMDVTDKPVFMDFRVRWDEKVFPMVPPGESIENMIFGQIKQNEKKLRVVK